MECLPFCTAILFHNCTHSTKNKHRSSFFLSRLEVCLEMDPNEKTILKTKEDIPTKPVEVNIESTSIAQDEPVFFDTTDQQETTEEEVWTHKEETRNAIPKDPPVITVSCYFANDLHKDSAIVNIAQLTKHHVYSSNKIQIQHY